MKILTTLLILLLHFYSINIYSQVEKLEVEGAIQIGNSEDPTPDEGTIRWNGCDFEGWDGTQWLSLTGRSFGTVSDNDGNIYQTITIGRQEWMAENLRTTSYNDGSIIPYLPVGSDWSTTTSGAYAYPNGDINNDADYGKLYNRYTVDSGNLCPVGWHIPSNGEFNTLFNFLGQNNGGKLKETGTTYFKSPNTGATNCSNFSARGAGIRLTGTTGIYLRFREQGSFWTEEFRQGKLVSFDSNNHGSSLSPINNGNSVRCIRD